MQKLQKISIVLEEKEIITTYFDSETDTITTKKNENLFILLHNYFTWEDVPKLRKMISKIAEENDTYNGLDFSPKEEFTNIPRQRIYQLINGQVSRKNGKKYYINPRWRRGDDYIITPGGYTYIHNKHKNWQKKKDKIAPK